MSGSSVTFGARIHLMFCLFAGACSEEELRQVLGLYGQTTGKGKVPRSELHGRPLELFMCSVLKRQGYGEGLRWIGQYLN